MLISSEYVYGKTNTQTFNYITSTEELLMGCGFQKGRYFSSQIGDVSIWHHTRS